MDNASKQKAPIGANLKHIVLREVHTNEDGVQSNGFVAHVYIFARTPNSRKVLSAAMNGDKTVLAKQGYKAEMPLFDLLVSNAMDYIVSEKDKARRVGYNVFADYNNANLTKVVESRGIQIDVAYITERDKSYCASIYGDGSTIPNYTIEELEVEEVKGEAVQEDEHVYGYQPRMPRSEKSGALLKATLDVLIKSTLL